MSRISLADLLAATPPHAHVSTVSRNRHSHHVAHVHHSHPICIHVPTTLPLVALHLHHATPLNKRAKGEIHKHRSPRPLPHPLDITEIGQVPAPWHESRQPRKSHLSPLMRKSLRRRHLHMLSVGTRSIGGLLGSCIQCSRNHGCLENSSELPVNTSLLMMSQNTRG